MNRRVDIVILGQAPPDSALQAIQAQPAVVVPDDVKTAKPSPAVAIKPIGLRNADGD